MNISWAKSESVASQVSIASSKSQNRQSPGGPATFNAITFLLCVNDFLLDTVVSLIYDITEMKKASESKGIAGNAGRSVGAWEGSCPCVLDAQGWGFDSPRLHLNLRFLPASGCNRSRGMSSGMSQGQGLKPAVILALRPEESKGQNDLFQLLPFC